MKFGKLLLQLVHAVMDHFANINDLLLRLAQWPHLRGSLIHLVKEAFAFLRYESSSGQELDHRRYCDRRE
ncbi:hypothetical protein BFJ66_g12674 [Fusarium oxysporum f. sp. cepae]|nr:hypothetical protein BFJ67_g12612 [Fusarium oxysporum f. sp. cepae]RKK38076.1 hypothetical protein BFJ66_g12674 [Fusarium oxysporum f. sp. cepae]